MGRLDDAVRHLRAAIDIGEEVGMPPAVAQATHQLARVLARRTRPGDRDEAAALATAAARWRTHSACARYIGRPRTWQRR
jgi:hypothetical protein